MPARYSEHPPGVVLPENIRMLAIQELRRMAPQRREVNHAEQGKDQVTASWFFQARHRFPPITAPARSYRWPQGYWLIARHRATGAASLASAATSSAVPLPRLAPPAGGAG